MEGVTADPRARKIDRGDFQTPPELAVRVCEVLAESLPGVAAVLEPTCGVGALLVAGARAFPAARVIAGFEIDEAYAEAAARAGTAVGSSARVSVRQADFFDVDWAAELAGLPQPLLVLGNPPWVTNAAVSRIGGSNVPDKNNRDALRGIEALTGKSNFDISEWMIGCLVEHLERREATVAMLCKTSVARKVLTRVWRAGRTVAQADLYRIDAKRWFGAAVDAGLFVVRMTPDGSCGECNLWPSLDAAAPSGSFGWRDNALVADVRAYERTRELGGGCAYHWRSGVKHDCARVMELRIGDSESTLTNGLGEPVQIEAAHRFPMRKGSELAADVVPSMRRHMIVPQARVGQDTGDIEHTAPRTWAYLCAHGDKLDARGSSIYRGRPRFSVFGVGDYTFAPWKVAIAGLYKKLVFRVVGPHEGRPVVFDDTCYFLPCASERQARALGAVLSSPEAHDFFSAFAFWDAKRPITAALLSRLDIDALAQQLGIEIPDSDPA